MTTKSVTPSAKKATNVSLNRELLKKARELDINLSATLEKALHERIAEKERATWKEKNRKAVEAYNDDIKELGLFSTHARNF